jgi:2-phospho-L-lactate transferase/gluconeogenesis factor (CofD/UPF0052 family)
VPSEPAPAVDGGVCVLSGGVGAARFLNGLLGVVAARDVTAVVNVGDDCTPSPPRWRAPSTRVAAGD